MSDYGNWVKEGNYWWNKETGDILHPDGTMTHDCIYRGDALQNTSKDLFEQLENNNSVKTSLN